jgi:oxygen-independent coproporphyrinogen-3 oxidase
MNERDPARWETGVRAHGTAVAHGERLTVAQARGEFVMTGLRRLAGVDTGAFARRFGASLDGAFPEVDALVADGLLERAGDRVRLTRRGLAFADAVAARFV